MSELIFSGFSAKAKFDGEQISCTSFAVKTNQNVLESSSAYGGQISGDHMAVHSPFLLDISEVSGSIGFEPTVSQLINLGNWIRNRNSSKSVSFSTGSNSTDLEYDECYFQSIGISCSENSLVTADIDMWMYQNKWATGTIGGATQRNSVGSPVTNVIPFWATTLEGLPNNDIVSWNLNISQQLTMKYYCNGLNSSTEAVLPENIFVGPLTADLNVNLIIAKNAINIEDVLKKGKPTDKITLKLNGTSILDMGKFVMTSLDPTLDDIGGANSISLSYKAYEVK